MTQPRSRVDLYAAIRRDARSGMSNRALQCKHGVGFRTVTAALESAWPKERKQPPKRGSRLDAYRVVIDDWLRSDLDAPRKQRHTAKRIFDRPFTDPRLCAAIVDRLTFGGTILETGTDSYRLAQATKQRTT